MASLQAAGSKKFAHTGFETSIGSRGSSLTSVQSNHFATRVAAATGTGGVCSSCQTRQSRVFTG
jgi:hypothetical protein